MSLQVRRLQLAALRAGMDDEWPVHGFLVTHPGGAGARFELLDGDAEILPRPVGRHDAGSYRVHFCHDTVVIPS
jgi:hypothetical protein